MKKTTLEQWRMFKAVVDHGGFSQASEVVNKSQSSIHHAVHKLESLLGVDLLHLEGRRVTLTEIGSVMLRRAGNLLDEVERMQEVAEYVRSGAETQLRIAVDQCFPQKPLYRVLDSVSRQYPQLYIELRETVLSGANELLKEGEVDLALSPYGIPGLLNEEICNVEFVAVAAPQHTLMTLPAPLCLKDLRGQRQIVLRDSSLQHKKDAGWLGAEQRWTVSHVRTSIDLLIEGQGYAWVPFPAICQYLDAGMLVPLPLSEGGSRSVPFYLNFIDADRLGPAARNFMGELRYQTLGLPVSGQKTSFE